MNIDMAIKHNYIKSMSEKTAYQWDETKRENNLRQHHVDFTMIERFNWNKAFTREDTRIDYGETRYVSIAPIDGRLFVAVWTMRDAARRLISLRKANDREEKIYDTTQIIYR